MNEKIQAILLGIIIKLKELGWVPGKEWEITFKSEGFVPMTKSISVQASVDDKEMNDIVETLVNLKLYSRDSITYFPSVVIYTTISAPGLDTKDVVHELEIDVAFTEKDVKNIRNIKNAANRANTLIEEYVKQEYFTYIESNAQTIKLHNMGAIMDDDDDDYPTSSS